MKLKYWNGSEFELLEDNGYNVSSAITANWVGSTAPFTQNIIIPDVSSGKSIVVTPSYSNDNETAILQREAWSLVSKIDIGDGAISVVCFEKKPITAIPILIRIL